MTPRRYFPSNDIALLIARHRVFPKLPEIVDTGLSFPGTTTSYTTTYQLLSTKLEGLVSAVTVAIECMTTARPIFTVIIPRRRPQLAPDLRTPVAIGIARTLSIKPLLSTLTSQRSDRRAPSRARMKPGTIFRCR